MICFCIGCSASIANMGKPLGGQKGERTLSTGYPSVQFEFIASS
jgi:hypothetical protein